MAELSSKSQRRIAVRSYALQALLNLKSMQGPGYLFTLWPFLRSRPDREPTVRVASGFINSHPVFSAFAQGAMLRRIEDGDAQNQAEFDSWRESLAGPLGLVGDQLIWDRWKPIVFALAIIPILLWPTMTTWVVTALTSLLVYNLPLYRLRTYALAQGFRRGARVCDALSEPWIGDARRILNRWAIITAGLVLGVTCAATAGGHWKFTAQFLIALFTALTCTKLRMSVYLLLLLSLFLALGFGSLV
jgi:mannose/fructose/N-acetylgalactosamine-specific phosphotransferase system component IID